MSSKYLDIFLKEAEEHLAALRKGLLVLEKEPQAGPLIHDLLRSAHTVKGSARMLGFEHVAAVGHRMEDFLKEMEEGVRPVEAEIIDLLLYGTDTIGRMAALLKRGEDPAAEGDRFIQRCCGGGDSEEQARPVVEETTETVRTDVATLDRLVNLLGELIISRQRFGGGTERLRERAAVLGDPLLAQLQREMEEEVGYLDYLVQELQGLAMGLRMLPLQTIIEPLHRLVRDLSRRQGKEVRLEVTGERIELDRVLLEQLKPVLMHIVTNCIDHGLEAPEERQASGKNPHGRISITARHEGNAAHLEISDDGRGMNLARIRETAVRRRLLTPEAASAMPDDDVVYFTLKSGFSTSEIVTDVSGRGVGMDVVRRNLEQVKGNLAIATSPGSGTRIDLQFPVTLSVVEALLVSCGGEPCAIPLPYVQETVKVREADLEAMGGKEVISLRGASVPVIPLATVLGLPQKRTMLHDGKVTAIVLRLRERVLAFTVDASLGTVEVVVKGLGKQLQAVPFVFGATILADGSPALILNPPDLFDEAEGRRDSSLREAFEEEARTRRRGRLLVVDDSITTRTMERSILSAHGYEVDLAITGEEALEKVASERYDLIITDIEMPGMNGFDLTLRLRQLDEYRDVPVIVVSSLSRDEDKRRALQAGAQAYIVKGSFEQGILLDTVEALIG